MSGRLLGKVALRRQPAAGRELAALDQRTQLLGDLPVEALEFDGLERHADERKLGLDLRLAKWSDQLLSRFGGSIRIRVFPSLFKRSATCD